MDVEPFRHLLRPTSEFQCQFLHQGVLDNITLQEHRFNTIKKDHLKGVLSYDEYLLYQLKLADALTSMVADS